MSLFIDKITKLLQYYSTTMKDTKDRYPKENYRLYIYINNVALPLLLKFNIIMSYQSSILIYSNPAILRLFMIADRFVKLRTFACVTSSVSCYIRGNNFIFKYNEAFVFELAVFPFVLVVYSLSIISPV